MVLTNIPLFKVYMSARVRNPAIETLYSGYITQGPRVEEFEKKLKEWLGVTYINTTNSGTSALQLALKVAGVEYKNRVISTPMTCTATNTAIRAVGGQIVWSDIDPTTGNIDANYVESLLKKEAWTSSSYKANKYRVKAVMVVHWGGYPCDLDAFHYLGDKYGVKIIEDAAHAFGATYNGIKIGSHSDFACFSFQAIKHLTTVDGGALVCKDESDHKRAKLLRWFGIDRDAPRRDFRCEEDVQEAGFKYHMNDFNATVGLHNLEDVDEIIRAHQENGLYYDKALKGIPGVRLLKRFKQRVSSYWLYTILVHDRTKFMERMLEHAITTSQVHSRNDLMTMFKQYYVDLPGVNQFTAHQVNIPVGWWVTPETRGYIENTIKEIVNGD